MRLRNFNAEFCGEGDRNNTTENEHSEKERKGRLRTLGKELWDATKTATKVIAVAVGMTIMAYGCAFESSGRYQNDTNSDSQAEVDSEQPDTIEPDIPDAIEVEDVPDAPDVPDMETEDVEDEELVEPTCFEIPTPIDSGVDTLLNNQDEESITFVGPGSKIIDTTVQKNVSMTGYPDIVLGECPLNPDAVAFIAGPRTYTVEHDVSVIAGLYSWSATVPDASGMLCPPFAEDTALLISHNVDQQEVPKNVLMGGVPAHAGFLLENINSGMVAYEIDGTVETSGTFTVPLGAYSPVKTVKALVLFGEMDIDVEVPAGASLDVHSYAATLTGSNSKEARIYPRTLGDNQIYNVNWDDSEVIWCARCTGNEILTLVVPGDIICKADDVDCGCIGDGFTIAIDSISLDKAGIPYALRGYYEEKDPPVRAAAGVLALSDPATDHPSVTVTLEKNRDGGLSDAGELARLRVIIDVTLTSTHSNLLGTPDTRTYTIIVEAVDPWAFGTSESPNYTDDCGGCFPII